MSQAGPVIRSSKHLALESTEQSPGASLLSAGHAGLAVPSVWCLVHSSRHGASGIEDQQVLSPAAGKPLGGRQVESGEPGGPMLTPVNRSNPHNRRLGRPPFPHLDPCKLNVPDRCRVTSLSPNIAIPSGSVHPPSLTSQQDTCRGTKPTKYSTFCLFCPPKLLEPNDDGTVASFGLTV
jgi:hypothetical protein